MAKERQRDDDIKHEEQDEAPSKRHKRSKYNSESESDALDSVDEKGSNKKRSSKKSSRNRSRSRSRVSDEESDSSSSEYSDSSSGSESDSYSEYSSEEERRRRRKRRERRKREEKERERSKRRRKDKDKKKRRRDEEKEDRGKKRKHKDKKSKSKKKKKEEKGKTGAVTNLWGKFGIIRETDMWNKRPEFTAWLSEVKKINLESLPNWEEKQMFKEFMEDHNTATFPSKKYYSLDAYYKHKMEKEMKKGLKKVSHTERTTFDDEEQRRLELLRERERQKEQEVEALKRSMQGGQAQAMKEQARLREEMAYLFKIGNSEAAAAIQRRLDPDLPM